VKKLWRRSGQDVEQFKNEVLLAAKLQHKNLSRLMGFCLEGEDKMLIYEFVSNRSLDNFLYGLSILTFLLWSYACAYTFLTISFDEFVDPKKQAQLDWLRRYKIIGGIARGIKYLHEDSQLKIIHRDLKASSILLDADMNPKISDFGMARILEVDQNQGDTSKIVGT
jgi:serine/threonine protein kinase